MHQVQVPLVELNRGKIENESEQTTSGEMVIQRAVIYITQTRSKEIFSK